MSDTPPRGQASLLQKPGTPWRPCSRCRAREAAIGTAGAAKPGTAFLQANRMRRFCEDFVLERSLALLGSGYRHA
ncbi:hypothetical protein PCAU_2265 [Pseudomonas chlororaphis subsp. aurantiaca]|nr:hypothetical protein PCAU_2265 [Pseudomonas chlororaphis subsp. aurantiaca]